MLCHLSLHCSRSEKFGLTTVLILQHLSSTKTQYFVLSSFLLCMSNYDHIHSVENNRGPGVQDYGESYLFVQVLDPAFRYHPRMKSGSIFMARTYYVFPAIVIVLPIQVKCKFRKQMGIVAVLPEGKLLH